MLVGIVGKPSCGKSTFFKAVTLADVAIASYPFTTIKPNRGAGHVKIECADRFFKVQCSPREGYCIDGERFVPVELLDVAGLVPGAHEGKGLGNQFLDDLRQAHVLIHIIDASGSTNENGEAVEPGSHDPSKDVLFLENELDMWYINILKKAWEKFARQTYAEKQKVSAAIAKQFSGLNANEPMVAEIIEKMKLDENPTKWTEDQLSSFATALRKKTKPMIIAANKADTKFGKENYAKLKEKFPGYIIIPTSAEAELALKEAGKKNLIKYSAGAGDFTILEPDKLSPAQKNALEFIKQTVVKEFGSTGVQKALNAAVLDILKLMPVFPGGVNKLTDQYGRTLPDCYLMSQNATALEFANRIHSDLAAGFIRAIDVKTHMTVGKEHKLKYGDVVEIISSK